MAKTSLESSFLKKTILSQLSQVGHRIGKFLTIDTRTESSERGHSPDVCNVRSNKNTSDPPPKVTSFLAPPAQGSIDDSLGPWTLVSSRRKKCKPYNIPAAKQPQLKHQNDHEAPITSRTFYRSKAPVGDVALVGILQSPVLHSRTLPSRLRGITSEPSQLVENNKPFVSKPPKQTFEPKHKPQNNTKQTANLLQSGHNSALKQVCGGLLSKDKTSLGVEGSDGNEEAILNCSSDDHLSNPSISNKDLHVEC
ncbi:hypothetical protein ACH5RR_016102 [Cinchona calisaya]|uniref:Uncharacterized protein n=1 Tax=Cinchona calisaya TaxID=153742 RepID=A0ABD2ZW76_9GENT